MHTYTIYLILILCIITPSTSETSSPTSACCNAQAQRTNAKNLVIKIMRDEVGKATESDPNKLIVDYISGG